MQKTTTHQETSNKLVKPYTCFQSQGHLKKRPTVVARLMLITCLAVDIFLTLIAFLSRPIVTLHQGQVIETSMIEYICYA